MFYNISIIVPIYNAQDYIFQCVVSLLEQDFENIEYIFIDDCSIDDSIQILNKTILNYPNRVNDIKVIKNLKNMGVSCTRKKGMEIATGTYVIQIDSDDWVEKNMCKELYKMAIETDADIIISDYYENFEDKQKYIQQKRSEDIDYFKSVLLGKLHGSLCNKIIKRSLYVENKIYPIESFCLFEDKFISLRLFSFTRKVVHISNAFLHYRQHESSFTAQNVKDRHIHDTIIFINELKNFLELNNLFEKYQDDFYSCVLYHKKIFLFEEKYFYLWDLFYPEVNRCRYVLGIESYDFKKKLVTILTLIFSKNLMKIAYRHYRKNRSK